REPVLALESAHPTTQRQAAHTGMRHNPHWTHEAVLLCGDIELAEQRSSSHPRRPCHRVDADAAHPREVDDQAAVTRAEPRQAVATAADGDYQVVVAAESHRRDHIVGVYRAHDESRAAVDHAVPHAPRLVVAGI